MGMGSGSRHLDRFRQTRAIRGTLIFPMDPRLFQRIPARHRANAHFADGPPSDTLAIGSAWRESVSPPLQLHRPLLHAFVIPWSMNPRGNQIG